MSTNILSSIGFEIDIEELMEKLRIEKDSEDAERLLELVNIAVDIARPKVMYKESYVDTKGDNYVVVDGVKLTSQIMRVNLDSVERVFPYVLTCGRELYDWVGSLEDILEQYWGEVMMEQALGEALKVFERHLEEHYHPGSTSSMNPGSLEDWPISQQEGLFSILGDPYEKIGVELTESFLMLPMKSLSGIRFATDTSFENCQLCSRENCQGRRVAYDHSIYYKRYDKKGDCNNR